MKQTKKDDFYEKNNSINVNLGDDQIKENNQNQYTKNYENNYNNKHQNYINKSKMIALVFIIIIFTGIAIFSIVIVFLEDPHVKVSQAVQNTFKQTTDYIDNILNINSLKDMLEKGTYTIETKVINRKNKAVANIKFASKENIKKSLKIFLFNNQPLELFFDNEDVYIKMDTLGDKIYKINYDKLNKKFEEFLENIDASSKYIEYLKLLKYYLTTEPEFERERKKVNRKIMIKSLKVLQKTDIKKIEPLVREINGNSEILKGYEFYIKGKEVLEIIDIIVDEINNNKIIKSRIILNSYFNQNGEIEYIELQDIEKELDSVLSSVKQSISKIKKEPQNIAIVFNTYLYKNFVANAKLNIYRDCIPYKELKCENNKNLLELSFDFESDGGSYPLENIKFVVNKSDRKVLQIQTNGTDNDDIFEFAIKVNNGYIPMGFKLFFDKKEKNIELSDFNDIITFLKTTILSSKKGENIEMSIEYPIVKFLGLKTHMLIDKKVENFEKPKGKVVDAIEIVENKVNKLFSIVKNKINNNII